MYSSCSVATFSKFSSELAHYEILRNGSLYSDICQTIIEMALKNFEKLSLSSDTPQSMQRQNIDRKLYARKYIYPVVDGNRPTRNAST